jgi:hypothetical protein
VDDVIDWTDEEPKVVDLENMSFDEWMRNWVIYK